MTPTSIPSGAPSNPQLVTIHIYDAVANADITLFPWHRSAIRMEYEKDSPPSLDEPELTPLKPVAVEPRPPSFGWQSRQKTQQKSQQSMDTQREELGVEIIEGMQLRHGRQTTRYPAGLAGFKDAATIKIDYWYSQELQSFVLVKQVGPFNSVHTLVLRNIRRENPGLALFTIPKDYKVEHVPMKSPGTVYLQ